MEKHLFIPQTELIEVKSDIKSIKDVVNKILLQPTPLNDWIPEEEAQALLGLKDTSMWALRKKRKIISSKIGARVFYSRKSIEKLLDKNQI